MLKVFFLIALAPNLIVARRRQCVIDSWEMTVKPADTAPPGAFTVQRPNADTVFRFTLYAAGEVLSGRNRVRCHRRANHVATK